MNNKLGAIWPGPNLNPATLGIWVRFVDPSTANSQLTRPKPISNIYCRGKVYPSSAPPHRPGTSIRKVPSDCSARRWPAIKLQTESQCRHMEIQWWTWIWHNQLKPTKICLRLSPNIEQYKLKTKLFVLCFLDFWRGTRKVRSPNNLNMPIKPS